MAEPRSYGFSPLEQRGVVAGLRSGQLAVLVATLVAAVIVLRVWPDGLGIGAVAGLALAASAVAFAPVRGLTVEQWAPTVSRRAARVARRAHRTRPVARNGRPRPELCAVPAAAAGLKFDVVTDARGAPVGVVRDGAAMTAILAVRGRSFALLDAADKERRLAGWATVLAAMSRENGPVRRVQWIERTVPGDAEALTRHLGGAGQLPPDHPALASYRELVSEAGPLGQDHECLVALTIRAGRRGPTATSVLLRELRLLEGQLRVAEIEVDHVLDPRQLGAVIRTAFDPWARVELARRSGAHDDLVGPLPDRAWPVSTEESWASWRTDDTHHATFWVAEWPRSEVSADFLAPVLLHHRAQRSVALIMSPLPPSAGVREAENARTAQAADEQLRQRSGFLTTARRRREADGVARREAELSDGHAAYRYCGYVTVTARGPEELETACGEVLQAAHQCRLELRRLYGAQDVAFTWTLLIGRGLSGR